ncbi:MAG: RNA recognition motif domain-containing protein, partial [Desulfatiglandales bacterium]
EVSMNAYIGNLSYEVTEEDLKKAFEGFGKVESAKVIKDNYSGKSREFGCAEMPNSDEARSAIDSLDGKELKERTLKVNKAKPWTEDGRYGGNRGAGRQGRGWRF